MNLQDTAGYSIASLRHRKMRTFLTVLGIVVGISSIILLVGLVQGLKQDVLRQLEDFGPRTLIITPVNLEKSGGFSGGFRPSSGKLFERDYERVKRFQEIDSIARILTGYTTLDYKDEALNSQVLAVEPESFEGTMGITIESGRFLRETDHGVAVLGGKVAERFKEDVSAGANILIAGEKYRVVGVLKVTGNSFGPVDNVVFIPFKEGRQIFNRSLLPDELSSIRITLKEGSEVDKTTERISDLLMASRGVNNDTKDFGILSPTFINAQLTNILDLLTLFLGAIASLSLIVGGIGISNTMFMSVMERRKEIGTMKAIGATQKQIREMFLMESGLLGLVGGFIGVIIALAIGFLIASLVHIGFVVEAQIVLGALFFAVLIGTISGTFPAVDAAKVDPIVALRYE